MSDPWEVGDAHYFSPSTRSTADPPPPLSPLNHIQSILCFFAFFPSLIHNKDGLQKERTTSQLVHRRSHFSDEAANLFDKLETPPPLAISQTPAGVNDEHAVREVSASRATRPPLRLDWGLSA